MAFLPTKTKKKNMSQMEHATMGSLSKEKLETFLKTHGLSAYSRNFISKGYDLSLLQEAEQDDLNCLCKELNTIKK